MIEKRALNNLSESRPGLSGFEITLAVKFFSQISLNV